MGYVIRLVINALALWITTLLISGVQITTESTGKKIGTIVLVAAIFGLINSIIRPIVKTIGCAFYVLTLGLIAIIVNGALLLLTSAIAGGIGLPFHVENFWPSAILGALIMGVISWLLSMVVKDGKQ